MADDVRAILSPVLLVCYLFGIKIIEFPAGQPKIWLGVSYILLLWLVYFFLLWYLIMDMLSKSGSVNCFFFWLNNLTALLSVVLGIYYDKKYRTCLRKLAMVDDTLEKIGTMADFKKLYTKILWTVFGWLAYIICITGISAVWNRDHHNIEYCFFFIFLYAYSLHVNLLDDLIITNTLRYIELKFKQINEYIRKLEDNEEHRIKRVWEHPMLLLRQTGYPKFTSTEYATWIVIHLHLELRKISRELNTIFGLQMTVKMAAYFIFMALASSEFLSGIFYDNNQNDVLYNILYISFIVLKIYKLFIINYICEKISVQASATGDVISKIPYSIYDAVVRENISQFLLQMSSTPLKFYGLGFFKFGLQFFYGFSSSITTVIVILIQTYTKT